MILDSLFRFLRRRRRPDARSKPRVRVVPTLETLEERWVPSATNGAMSLQSLIGASAAGISQPIDANSPSTPTSPVQTVTTPPANSSGTQTQTVSASFAPFKTGGSESQTVAQFDPSLGTLTGIQILLNGKLTSDVQVENLDASPSNVGVQIGGNLTLQGPGFHPQSVTPSLNESTTLSAFDGALDYAGTSGKDFGNQSAQASHSLNLSAASNDLSAWIGKGAVTLTELAQSTSTVSGSGNEQVHIATQGSGSVQVSYLYTPAPPPASPPPVAPPASPPPVSPPPVSPPSTCVTPTGPGSIGGIVYVDAGKLDHYITTDAPVGGVTVNLTGTTLAGLAVNLTTTTGPNGAFNFTNLDPGTYTLSDVQPAGYTRGAETLGSLGGLIVGDQMIIALPQGGDGMCYDFGEIPPPPPPAPPPPPPPNNPPPNGTPISTPVGPPITPATPVPFDPGLPVFFPPPGLSKRSLLGDGWQSLG